MKFNDAWAAGYAWVHRQDFTANKLFTDVELEAFSQNLKAFKRGCQEANLELKRRESQGLWPEDRISLGREFQKGFDKGYSEGYNDAFIDAEHRSYEQEFGK